MFANNINPITGQASNFWNYQTGMPLTFTEKMNNIVNPAANLTQGANQLTNLGDDIANSAGNAATKGSQALSNTLGAIGAGVSLVNMGMGIADAVDKGKQAREQLAMAKKNYNLELEKMQKNELQHNELAATIDKAWGGDGAIDKTIDYSKYGYSEAADDSKNNGNAISNNLASGGLGGGYVKGGSNANASTSSNASMNASNANPSGNTNFIGSSGGLEPVGYSETIGESEDENQEEK